MMTLKACVLLLAWMLHYVSVFGQNVGFGTATPMYPLHLFTADGYGLVHDNGSVRVGTGLIANSHGFLGTFTEHRLVISAGETGLGDMIIDPNGNIGIGVLPNTSRLYVRPGNGNSPILDVRTLSGSQALLVNSIGAVGIGTNTPAYPLTVKMTTGSSGYGIVHDNGNVNVGTFISGTAYGWMGTLTNHPLRIGAGAASRIYILTNGNVGIGNSTPITPFYVTGQTKLNRTTAEPVALDINGGIKVSGANPAAFVLTANAANMFYNFSNPSTTNCEYLRIDNIYSNNNPNALIFITPRSNELTRVIYDATGGYWYIAFAEQLRASGFTYIGTCVESLPGQCVDVPGVLFGATSDKFLENLSKFNVLIFND